MKKLAPGTSTVAAVLARRGYVIAVANAHVARLAARITLHETLHGKRRAYTLTLIFIHGRAETTRHITLRI